MSFSDWGGEVADGRDYGPGGEQRGVEHSVVVGRVAPCLAGVVGIMVATDGVLPGYMKRCFLSRNVIVTYGPLSLMGRRGMKEYVDASGTVAQHIVGTAANDNAGTFGSQTPDDTALSDKESIFF